jgi:uncharacterized membrane protein YheB (UPF0754 family)
MISSFIVVGAIFGGVTNALARRSNHDLINRRPYNNRYSDATGARDERTMLS